jgi:acetate kinase
MESTTAGPCILTINGGSSSIKFAFFQVSDPLNRLMEGEIDRVGERASRLVVRDLRELGKSERRIRIPRDMGAVNFLTAWLSQQSLFSRVKVVGHRIVHGMEHSEPEVVTSRLLKELRRAMPMDPGHLPGEIELIERIRELHPRMPQWACFDTGFHHGMPRVATLLALPRRLEMKGIRRYGFHGLSYSHLMEELVRMGDPSGTRGRVILAHLGNGASVAAVRNGRCVDTSMGFTPTGGLMMGTRSGDLDPGIAPYLARIEGTSQEEFDAMVTGRSGLLGVSETSSDMRDLLRREQRDVRAREAVDLFCYQAKKWIGGYAAVLGGVDTLVFSGGIGEHCASVRSRICEGLEFLGVKLSSHKNAKNAGRISKPSGRVNVQVIRSDEERMMARLILLKSGVEGLG